MSLSCVKSCLWSSPVSEGEFKTVSGHAIFVSVTQAEPASIDCGTGAMLVSQVNFFKVAQPSWVHLKAARGEQITRLIFIRMAVVPRVIGLH